jgi:hypothetical protein
MAAAERYWLGAEGRPSRLRGITGISVSSAAGGPGGGLVAGLAAFRREPVLALVCDHAWCAVDA